MTLIDAFPYFYLSFDAVQLGDTFFSFVLVTLYVRCAMSQKMHFSNTMIHRCFGADTGMALRTAITSYQTDADSGPNKLDVSKETATLPTFRLMARACRA
jgi:hypothetical protein